MGEKCKITLKNKRLNPIVVHVCKQRCMYDMKKLEGKALAMDGELTETVQTKASGSCFFSNSSFTLDFLDKEQNSLCAQIHINSPGTRNFSEEIKSEAKDTRVMVFINNDPDPAVVKITLYDKLDD